MKENVAFAYKVTGTHEGEFIGVAPARGMQISKFENGKLVEQREVQMS